MAEIKLLSRGITNLIAAGEVVTGIKSVVKELVENSIDALATSIKIELTNAGLTEIKVTDDGTGMNKNDAKMAVMPHATSKISSASDLYNIGTLGFRGEALAAIAAVANFRLTTSVDGYHGFMYSLKCGKPVSEAMVSHEKGTEVSVRNLFLNMPVRLASLKKESVELSYVIDLLTRIAVIYPHISFHLLNNNKTLLKTIGTGDSLTSLASVMGTDAAKAMIPVSFHNETYKISGFASDLNLTKATKNCMYFSVNKRPIRSFKLNNAAVSAYDTLLMVGRYPVLFLDITVDYAMVDVNIHPGKQEVKFADEDRLCQYVTKSIKDALTKVDLTPKVKKNSFGLRMPDNAVPGEYETWQKEEHENSFSLNASFLQQQFSSDFTSLKDPSKETLAGLTYIAQIFGTYLIASTDSSLLLIDQHAAAERVNYEKIMACINKEEIIAYDLLVPFNLEFSPSDYQLIKDCLGDINKLGIGIEDFGNNTYTVRRLPVWIYRGREKEFCEEIISHIIHRQKKTKQEFMQSLAKSLACKKSIKGNEFHNRDEIIYLLSELKEAENPFTCPHGRPIIVKITLQEIEKWFKRIV